MAKHTWNSTPPRLWPIARLAAERGWTITIRRAGADGDDPGDDLALALDRRPDRDPAITIVWGFWYDTQPGRNQPGQWKLAKVQVRSRADVRPVAANLRDVPRLLLEADRG